MHRTPPARVAKWEISQLSCVDSPRHEEKALQTELFQNCRKIWDSQLKPSGIFGAHINTRSLISKAEKVYHFLSN